MKSQKEAVIEEVKRILPNFVEGVDNALSMLTEAQLESIKTNIFTRITAQNISYSKDVNDVTEVKKYARSMVMNHLKKSKELSGGISVKTNSSNTDSNGNSRSSVVRSVQPKVAPKGVNLDLLPDELKDFAKSLI